MRKVMLAYFISLAGLTSTALDAHAQTAAHCEAVYYNATRDIAFSESSYSSLNTVFDEYCSSSGEMRTSNSAIGIDAVLKSIPISFTGSNGSSEEKMRNFCRSYSSVRYTSAASSAYRNSVVVEALNAFNQCIDIAGEGVKITFAVADGLASSFSFRFGSTVNYELQGAVVGTNLMCTTRLDENSEPIVLNIDSLFQVDRNFSINCQRIPEERTSGSKYYLRTSVIFSSNHGPYSAIFPAEEILDVEFATILSGRMSSIEDKTNSVANEFQKYISLNNDKISKIHSGLRIRSYLVFTGENREGLEAEWIYIGRGDISGWAANTCGNLNSNIQVISSVSGGCCGYTRAIVSCFGFE